MNAPRPGSVSELLRQLNEEGALEKVAAQGGFGLTPEDEETIKLAEEIDASGRVFGKAAAEAMIEKLAEAAASATGAAAPSQGDLNEAFTPDSLMKKITDKVMNLKGHESGGSTPSAPGTSPNVLAEEVAPEATQKNKSPNPMM